MAVLWILTIGIGLASAMDPTQSPGQCPFEKGHMHPGFELTNATFQQQMISRFEEQGIDTSGLKAAFASGNENDVKTWLDAHRPARPENAELPAHQKFDLTNTTLQQQMINRFEQRGIDTSGLKAAFSSGNETDVETWLDAHRPTHPGGHRHNGQGDNNSASKSCIQ